MSWTLYEGDCLDHFPKLADASVDLTVTSPPYGNLRTYHGFRFDFEAIAAQLYRVTKPGGVVVWVVGDATVNGSETGTSFRQALFFKEIGFNLHDTMIYRKACGGAGSRLTYIPNFEYMFVLSKGAPHAANLLRDRANKSFGDTGQYRTRTFRRKTDGGTENRRRQVAKRFGRRFNIWEYNPGSAIRWGPIRGGVSHPAPFPEAPPRDHILSWSNPGDLVLDPMAGSGTTLKMAELLGRDSVGMEVSSAYCDLIRQRMQGVTPQPTLFEAAGCPPAPPGPPVRQGEQLTLGGEPG